MNNAQHGFTLLEVLLAMTVLGVVMAMLSLSLSGSMRLVESTEQEEEILTMAQTAMRRITEDIASAFWTREEPFLGTRMLEAGHRADRLDFCSLAHLVFNPDKQQPGPARIGYRLENDEEDRRKYRLVRSDEPLLPGREVPERTATAPAFVLAENLRSLQFTYFDRQGQEMDNWQAEFDEQDPRGQEKLPAAVHCILEFWVDADQETVRIFSTRVVLPVGAWGGT